MPIDRVCSAHDCRIDTGMVYISSWHEYQEAAEALYTKSPNDVRILLS
jgi:hypothetical protein